MRVSRGHAVTVVLLLLTGLSPLVAQQASDGTSAMIDAVALGGFTNLSGAASVAWIGPGIVEVLSVELRTLGFTVVEQRTDADVETHHSGRDTAAPAVTIGTALGARWVVSGRYQRLGPRLRVTVDVTDVTSEAVSTVRHERPYEELFDLQDAIVADLGSRLKAARLDPRLTSATPAAAPAVAPGVTTPLTVPTAASRSSTSSEAPVVIDGPPAAAAPATLARDAMGRATIRAVRITESLVIDGALDERVYRDVLPASDFIQNEPVEGVPATEETEVWVFFDDDNLYIGVRCWDSAPQSRWVANEMRRDNNSIVLNDEIGILLDTFYDRRNGVLLNINAIGGRTDGQLTDARNYSGDWNPVWDLRTGRFENGWTVELAFPFKSLRYRRGRTQVWGFNVRRSVRWKNEISHLSRVPAGLGLTALFHAASAATMVGLEAPEMRRTLELKPYVIADLKSDRSSGRRLTNDLSGDTGLDVKYGVTQGLVGDLTVNTDFAQVEADEQQINLTRFSLFFPEKREFFLENQGLFAFGGAGAGVFGGGGDTPLMFYSRRIGLSGGQEVPIAVGGRLSGRVGALSVGALNIQTDAAPEAGARATNFSVVRLRRDILRRSAIGAILTRRSISTRGHGANETYGLDGLFAFYDNLTINTYWATTSTSGLPGSDDDSYRAQLDYNGDRYGVQLERLVVGTDFNPEVGFLRRDDFSRSFGVFRFSPRPQAIAAIRKLSWEGKFDYITDRDDVLETREAQGAFGIEFENGDQFNTTYTQSQEFLEHPFPIATGVTIPVGRYDFQDVQASFSLGQQRRFSGRFSVQHGTFYSGEKTTIGFNRGRLELTPQFSLEPSYSYNRVDLPEGLFMTQLVRTRTTYTLTPLMFVSALVQYNSSNDSLSTNLRLRWEYTPGSELFVVYNEDRDTNPLLPDRFAELRNRAFVIKVNRLFRF